MDEREGKKKHVSPDVSGTCRCLGKFCVLSSFPSGGEVGADDHDVMLENADTVVQKWTSGQFWGGLCNEIASMF